MKNLTPVKQELVLRFLLKIALSDQKILDEELALIREVATILAIDFSDHKKFIREWTKDDEAIFQELIHEDSESLGFITKWATDIMNSDNIKHQNEQRLILNLIKASLDNPQHPRATLIPVSTLDEVQIEMMKKTPAICLEKANHWQKKKKDKPIKRVAASISFIKNGKKDFVTGVNYELSTPGGSRCAEQNAIGILISQNPQIKKEEILDIFIYGAGGLTNPCWPCGICSENISKINSDNQVNLYVYPENYVYANGVLPENILKISFSDFIHL